MSKKNLIQICVIVACFAASGIVIYNNFLKGPSLPLSSSVPAGMTASTNQPILPNGPNLDLEKVRSAPFQFQLIEYPKLDFATEVGLTESQMIRPMETQQVNN